MRRLVLIGLLALAFAACGCGGGGGGAGDTYDTYGSSVPYEYTGEDASSCPQAVLISLSLSPSFDSVTVGASFQFVATGLYSDGSVEDLTFQVDWMSSQPSVAAISRTGRVTALAGGLTEITAIDPTTGVNGGTSLDVSGGVIESVQVSPSAAVAAPGASVQFTATATLSDGTVADVTHSVVWSTADPSIAAIDAAGRATATGASGSSTTVTATSEDGASGSATLTVGPAATSSPARAPAPPN